MMTCDGFGRVTSMASEGSGKDMMGFSINDEDGTGGGAGSTGILAVVSCIMGGVGGWLGRGALRRTVSASASGSHSTFCSAMTGHWPGLDCDEVAAEEVVAVMAAGAGGRHVWRSVVRLCKLVLGVWLPTTVGVMMTLGCDGVGDGEGGNLIASPWRLLVAVAAAGAGGGAGARRR